MVHTQFIGKEREFMKITYFALFIVFSFISFFDCRITHAKAISPVENISMEKAKHIALEQVKGKIIAAKQEKDDGLTKYEIIIETKKGWYEVEIDKATGKVLEVEKEGSKGDSKSDDDDDEIYDD